jgi:hypothetical protein
MKSELVAGIIVLLGNLISFGFNSLLLGGEWLVENQRVLNIFPACGKVF